MERAQVVLLAGGWFQNTGNLKDGQFKVHNIDRLCSPHSISVADLDGGGMLEVIAGERDPFKPYRSQCRLYAYKQADPQGITWARFPLDDRFEHHDGAKVMELSKGRHAIISHGWMEQAYVHLRAPEDGPKEAVSQNSDQQPV